MWNSVVKLAFQVVWNRVTVDMAQGHFSGSICLGVHLVVAKIVLV